MEEYLEFAVDVAYQAGKIMLKYFNQNNGASYKGDKTIATLADTEINSYLIEKVTLYVCVILLMEQLCMLDIYQ